MTTQRMARVIWITGLPATGKSTLARHVVDGLRENGLVVLWLDSDDLRSVITPNATYTEAERDFFYRALGHIAVRAAEGGVTVVVSATAPRRRYRDEVRRRHPGLVEVLLVCDPKKVRDRDYKGLYRKADDGLAPNLPGVGGAFEDPAEPELVVDTGWMSAEQGARCVLRWVAEHPLDPGLPRTSGATVDSTALEELGHA